MDSLGSSFASKSVDSGAGECQAECLAQTSFPLSVVSLKSCSIEFLLFGVSHKNGELVSK